MGLQNLRGTSPIENEGFYSDYAQDRGIEIAYILHSDRIQPLFVIVEQYEKKRYGRVKREYLARYNEAERKTISRYYGKLYDWYLRSGIPHDGVKMRPATYALLADVANFFASI